MIHHHYHPVVPRTPETCPNCKNPLPLSFYKKSEEIAWSTQKTVTVVLMVTLLVIQVLAFLMGILEGTLPVVPGEVKCSPWPNTNGSYFVPSFTVGCNLGDWLISGGRK